MSEENILKATFDLGFTYTRSTGPIIGYFLTQLQKCKLVGIKGANNKVIFPPAEYDPTTGESLSEFIEVSEIGIVITWVWVKKPLNKHPQKIHNFQKYCCIDIFQNIFLRYRNL